MTFSLYNRPSHWALQIALDGRHLVQWTQEKRTLSARIGIVVRLALLVKGMGEGEVARRGGCGGRLRRWRGQALLRLAWHGPWREDEHTGGMPSSQQI